MVKSSNASSSSWCVTIGRALWGEVPIDVQKNVDFVDT